MPPPPDSDPSTAPATAIRLRRANAQDAAAYARILGHPGVQPHLLQMPYGDEQVWRIRLAEPAGADQAGLHLVAELDGEVVGNAGLHTESAVRRRHVLRLGIGVLPEAQGRGVGAALMQGLCDYADQWAQALRVELTVYADNRRAIALYERFGFVTEGRHRAFALRAGRYVDALSMARLHPDPPRLAEQA